MTSPQQNQEHVDLRAPLRSELEVAANAVWALIAAEVIPHGTSMAVICDATGLTLDHLRLAQQRSERVVARRLKPTDAGARPLAVVPGTRSTFRRGTPPTPQLPPEAYVRDLAPDRGDLQPVRTVTRTYTEAGRRRAAERIFAEWRVRGALDCTRCGQPICSGEDAVITAAHHARECTA